MAVKSGILQARYKKSEIIRRISTASLELSGVYIIIITVLWSRSVFGRLRLLVFFQRLRL